MKKRVQPKSYNYILAPTPRPVSTVGLGEIFSWFFPGEYLPPIPNVHPLAQKCRTDPDYTIFYPDGTCASEREVGHTLYVLCRLLRPKNVVEVGCYHGASSICIAAALQKNEYGHLHCIDINGENIEFTSRNLQEAGLLRWATLIEGNSISLIVTSQIPKASLIFIDADHDYRYVRDDFINYRKKLTRQGIIVLHDSVKIMDIRRLLNEILEQGEYDIFTLATSDGDGMSLLKQK